MVGRILLILGIFEVLLGIILYFKKDENFIFSISKLYNRKIILSDIRDNEIIKKFLGQMISIEGGMYLFLGSVSIYSKIDFLVVIILIIAIEVTFFYIIKSKLNSY